MSEGKGKGRAVQNEKTAERDKKKLDFPRGGKTKTLKKKK